MIDTPEKFTPLQIDGLIQSIGDQKEKADNLNDKAKEIDDDIIQRIKDLEDLVSGFKDRKGLHDKIKALADEIQDNLGKSRDVLDRYPNLIDLMIATNDEMKIGSLPDDTADYWEERKTIEQNLKDLKEDKTSLAALDTKQTKLEKDTTQTL